MARASSIWLVHNRDVGQIIAAFTVRRELVTWLRDREEEGDPLFSTWTVSRLGDGMSRGNRRADVRSWSAAFFIAGEA